MLISPADNHGIPSSDVPEGDYSLANMVADPRDDREELDLAPWARTSSGGHSRRPTARRGRAASGITGDAFAQDPERLQNRENAAGPLRGSGGGNTIHGQSSATDDLGDRRKASHDDLICPAHLVAEVADATPDCDLVAIPDCGHHGYPERPEAVNPVIIAFFDGS